MQSDASNTLVKLAKAVIEHAPEGGDAFWDIKFSDIEAALSAAEPVSRRNDEAGYVEFLNQDVPYIVRDIQGAVAILMDLETRNVIGYRVYDPDSVFAPQSTTDRYKPLQSENATKPVAWVYAADLEKGDGCFGNAKGEVCMSRDGKWINVDTPLYAAPPALSAQVQDVAGWQDISTLEPKDGMIVMGWGEYRERDGFSPAFMRWYDSVGGWNVNAMPFYPTHWMPLPAAPAKQEG